MKYFLFMTLILSSHALMAQDDDNFGLLDRRKKKAETSELVSPYKDYKLEGGQLLFDRVYMADSMKGELLGKILAKSIPQLKGLTDFRIHNDVITCRFYNAMIDYKRMGHKWGTTPILLNNPFDANVTIVWKDGKYKVTLSNIIFKAQSFGHTELDIMLTRKKKTAWDTRAGAMRIGEYTEQYFTDLFKIKEDSDW